MKSYWINPSQYIDRSLYKYIPEVYDELCKRDVKVRVVKDNGDGTVIIDTDYGIRTVNMSELQER